MSVIQKIRDKAAWIVTGAIGISLLAFILQDYFFNKGRSSMGNGNTIGKINGQSIDRDVFEHKVSFYEQMNNGQIQRNQLIPQVWDYMVNQTIVNQESEKLGLDVTPNELSDILFGNNPPQFMQQLFSDPKTGLFDANTARQRFAAIKAKTDDPQVQNFNEAYIDPQILQTKAEKYQSLISGAVYVPKWMSEKMNADANAVSKASYVYVPYTSISDSTVKVSADEMEAYIKKHPKQFERDEATRTISYVTFSGAPTANDSAAVRNELEQLKNEFASTNNEKAFLNAKGNEAQYYNGVIGGKEIKQAIKDTLFNLAPGQIYGPYVDGSSYVLAKMVAKQTIPDSATVRHILVATNQQDPNSGQLVPIRDDSAAMKRLDSAIALIKNGASFDSVVIKYSDDPGSKDKGGVYNYFASGQMDPAFNDFAFTGKVGETKVVHTAYGYHYVEILGQHGSETGYKIAYLSKPIAASQETDNAASNAASQFAAASRNQQEFETNAKNKKLTILPSQEFRENDFTVPGVGESRELVKWAYDNKPGAVSEPFNVNANYVVALLTGVSEKGLASPTAVQQTVEPLVRNEKKAQIIIAQQMKGSTLEQVAQNAHQTVQRVDSLSFSAFVVPQLGNEPQFIGAAFNKQMLNKVSSPIAGNSGVYVIRPEGVSGTANVGQTPEMQKQQAEQMLKQQVSQEVSALRKAADIEDNRSKFY
ncbi:MAG: SurA N-terminal domain-containing protein [Parafilimonas sp.]|nr:SurA N-terminal domain-containing protein [Parafilimonas sp.]